MTESVWEPKSPMFTIHSLKVYTIAMTCNVEKDFYFPQKWIEKIDITLRNW